MAQRLFGDADPLGQSLTISSIWSRRTEDFTITGVAAPVPRTSSIQFNMLLPFDNTEFLMHASPGCVGRLVQRIYVLLKPECGPGRCSAGLLAAHADIQMLQHEGIGDPKRPLQRIFLRFSCSR